ncbi:hypothetical protein [Lentibacillus jeotgali]|uniref:hypothetical protein n=1 Tax=Lentibacillus jeotgali TaxID=558169 RepID=UPI0002627422|nr:hypothetical protein [Lentibacillus jeotgali]
MEIWIPVIVALISSVTSYFLATYKGKTELRNLKKQQEANLKKMEEQRKADLEKMEKQHAQEIERIKTEIQSKSELYENQAQTGAIKNIMEDPLSANQE